MPTSASSEAAPALDDTCVVCGVAALTPRLCKVICRHCGTIVQSCADLYAEPATYPWSNALVAGDHA